MVDLGRQAQTTEAWHIFVFSDVEVHIITSNQELDTRPIAVGYHMGGHCPELAVCWPLDLAPDESARTQTNRQCTPNNTFDIKTLKLLGMVMTAGTMIVVKGD